jgi:tRNA (guanine37-N1)-methyltransferase
MHCCLLTYHDHQVDDRVRTYNMDARDFIKRAVIEAWERPFNLYGPRISAKERAKAQRAQQQQLTPSQTNKIPPKRIVDHFVMNLPAMAIEFLDAYRGLYAPLRDRPGFAEELRGKDGMPLVHCYCFTKDVENAEEDICSVG